MVRVGELMRREIHYLRTEFRRDLDLRHPWSWANPVHASAVPLKPHKRILSYLKRHFAFYSCNLAPKDQAVDSQQVLSRHRHLVPDRSRKSRVGSPRNP